MAPWDFVGVLEGTLSKEESQRLLWTEGTCLIQASPRLGLGGESGEMGWPGGNLLSRHW